MSQIQFAARVADRLGHKWHQTRLSHLEQGNAEPTLAELAACADVAGVPIAWLAYGLHVSTPDQTEVEGRRQWLLRYRLTQADAPALAPAVAPAAAPAAAPSRSTPPRAKKHAKG